jgi:carbon storage regulator
MESGASADLGQQENTVVPDHCRLVSSGGGSSMLVLTRKGGEEILVPEHDIVIRILDAQGGKVRLGITAPAQTQVYRREVWERLQQQSIDQWGDLYG